MGAVGPQFSQSVFRKDFPMPIATNRISAILLPVMLRYNSAGYVAGTVLARNTTDGLYDAYNSGGSSGTNVAACVLFEGHAAEDFNSTASSGNTGAVGIFGGCTVFKDSLPNYNAGILTDLSAKLITDASGVVLVKF
jgi:hypothetical protein